LEPLIIDLIPHTIEVAIAWWVSKVGKIHKDPVRPNPFAVHVPGGLQPPVCLPGTEEGGHAIGFSDLLAERRERAVAGPAPTEPSREEFGTVTYGRFVGIPESMDEFDSMIHSGTGHGA